MIVEATGWKVSMFAGGPEPADDCRLNVIRYVCIHLLAKFISLCSVAYILGRQRAMSL